jgi:hypothetical protein
LHARRGAQTHVRQNSTFRQNNDSVQNDRLSTKSGAL